MFCLRRHLFGIFFGLGSLTKCMNALLKFSISNGNRSACSIDSLTCFHTEPSKSIDCRIGTQLTTRSDFHSEDGCGPFQTGAAGHDPLRCSAFGRGGGAFGLAFPLGAAFDAGFSGNIDLSGVETAFATGISAVCACLGDCSSSVLPKQKRCMKHERCRLGVWMVCTVQPPAKEASALPPPSVKSSTPALAPRHPDNLGGVRGGLVKRSVTTANLSVRFPNDSFCKDDLSSMGDLSTSSTTSSGEAETPRAGKNAGSDALLAKFGVNIASTPK
mmetsp:Transcript_64096/g.111768  ORF Transcript_64096/g.111768 Transcript_64096/m.111768 type:complete len:273 (-) Transcript_64096:191-1009(-)